MNFWPLLLLAEDGRFDWIYLVLAAVVCFGSTVVALLFRFLSRSRQTRLLSYCPRVHAGEGFVIARTSRKQLAISLGLLNRTVIADRAKQTVTIRSRWLWFFKREKKIPFEKIEKVLYEYEDNSPGTSLGGTGDVSDDFAVRLRLTDGDVVHLFHFIGDGGYTQGWDTPDWLWWTHWWRRHTDMKGKQEDDSRAFVKHLERVLGERKASR